ncbi:MAG TPA: TRAP transporter substrate-binding protein DctP [Candidatus Aquicultoraceae bacterium]|nr:TRAP transporter substrate-binding protein DctP [Candidatus Aquicultoraceae bacterium]
MKIAKAGWIVFLVLFGLSSFPVAPPAGAQNAKIIKISHQFPGGTADEGDFRDRLARKFAQEVEKRTNGALKFEIYPAGSLVKSKQQFDAMSRGALDMSVYPLAYQGGKLPMVNITLMPALITSYEQGLRWKTAPIGKELAKTLEANGVKIVTWVWQAGGNVSRDKPILNPDDVRGLKVRGAGKSIEVMLKAAGAAIVSIPSDEAYSALQSGVADGLWTSSGSLVSYRLYEVAKHVTTARDKTFWYMFEPLLMAKSTFDGLTPEQQKIVMEVGASLEPFVIQAAKEDDKEVADVYGKAGVKIHDMDAATFAKWRKLAKESAWKEYAEKVPDGKRLMDLAEAVE